ncbi:cyclase [Penicillium vulpinum]|uniref:cyclase n=1 Tax=Penicillium vulpinum TaxID=29845 RepID=UPI00254797BB|nr:cyclase [Penicillium vulpinum]KAJ5960840.1 cyclase [Penicillium vulpinum]
MSSLPNFDDLPPVNGMPQGCSWGIFDKGDKKDVLGTLNLLTPEVVKDAVAEVRHGVSISLNWPIGSIKIPGFFRKSLCHNVTKLEDPVSGSHYGFDDEVEFNTQASSQWDSFAHFTHLPAGLTYNGVKPTIEAFHTPESAQHLPTLDRRGVMLDFKSYAEIHGISYNQFSGFRIGITELEAVATWQGLTFRAGDILLIRFGVTETLGQMTGAEQGAAMCSGRMCGLEGSKEIVRWLWDRHFAAVVSDNSAVEAMPPIVNGVEQPTHELVLHQWCLSLLGIPLGELWDLKELAEACRASKQYSFLLTSSPLNFPGAIASPPNALAIL